MLSFFKQIILTVGRKFPRPIRIVGKSVVLGTLKSFSIVYHSARKILRPFARKSLNYAPLWIGSLRGKVERGGKGGAPVCIMGLHRANLGLGRGARLFRKVLEQSSIDTLFWDVSKRYSADVFSGEEIGNPRLANTTIFHLNPIEMVHAIAMDRGERPRKGLRIGYWAWETSKPPDAWRIGFGVVDEVWCPSSFTANAIAKIAPKSAIIRVVPHPSKFETGQPNRAKFKIPENKYVFFTAADVNSSLCRKNPFGAIKAFAESKCGQTGDAALIVKISNMGFSDPETIRLFKMINETEGVHVISKSLSDQDMADLIASVDAVISLHRAEGFGLILAEAVAAAKPVIATNWSGNLDFMDEKSAALIDAIEIPVADPQDIYREGVWADPDLSKAAIAIQKFVNDPQRALELGKQGQTYWRAFANQNRWISQFKLYCKIQ